MSDAPAMAEGLMSLLADVQPDRQATLESFAPISGGYSRVTTRATVQWSDGTTQTFLLRADPIGGGGVFRSDRDKEWALLTALAASGSLSIPKPLYYDGDGAHFGTKCMVIDFCEAVSLQAQIESGRDLDEATGVLVYTAAAIHQVPLAALPQLSPPEDWVAYMDSVIDIFERTGRTLAECGPAMRYVGAWLRRHRPDPVPLTLVHGDFQPGNVLVRPNGETLVIDWEFGRIGDPREDLGYYIQVPMTPNLINRDPVGSLARYRAQTGLSEDAVNPEVVQYFLMIGMARLLAQLVDGAVGLDEGRGGGAMTTYLINAISHQCDEYVRICRGRA